ncbi:MAG: PD40 domain-containing protein [Bryobacterales bacterium]|nr:PD40 domain-containing protein [Bryobacterales bacterium]
MKRRTFLLGTLGTLGSSIRAFGTGESRGMIAFVEIDGLWVRALPDGEPRNLIGGPVSFPQFSPSGQWILFAQNGITSITSLDGKQVRRIGDNAAWSPVSDDLWVRNEDADALELFSARNGWSSAIGTISHASLGVFRPDGSEMIYMAGVQSEATDDASISANLCRVALKDGAQPAILQTTSEEWSPCAWTRDGKSIVYWMQEERSASEASDGNELFLLSASGGKPRSLGVTTLLDPDFVQLSPVRNELALTAGGERNEWHNKRLAVVDLNSVDVRYLMDQDTVGLSPSWSPDGHRIAYSAGPAPASEEQSDLECGCDEASQKRLNELLSKRRIWISDRTGAQPPRQLTSDSRYHDEEPLWSANGQRILFTRSDSAYTDIHTLSSDQKTLWLMDQDGSNPTQVAGPLYVDPDLAGSRRCAFDWFRGAPKP